MRDSIFVKGARENNLKNIDVEIPRDKLVVFTGISGSGKSTLAFDTIFAEGQRRYVESLSSYARQFLGQMKKPDVDYIDGLSPSISIDQKTTSRNPRSTVGTVTEIYDYFRLLFARVGTPFCPECGKKIEMQTIDQICDKIMAMQENSKILVLAPIARGKKGEFQKNFEQFRKSGYARVKVDGNVYSLDEEIKLDRNIKHDIYVVIDRLVVKDGIQKRLADSVESAIKLADGILVIDCEGVETKFSTKYACPDCGISIDEIEPRLFSFNSPFGACPDCLGLGYVSKISEELIVPNMNLSLKQGAIKVGGWNLDTSKFSDVYFNALSEKYGFSMDTPYNKLPKKIRDILLYGNNGEMFEMKYQAYRFNGSMTTSFEGVITNLERRYKETSSDGMKSEIEKYMVVNPCTTCNGARLKKEALSVRINGKNIAEMSNMSIFELYDFIDSLELDKTQAMIAENIVKEIKTRLNFLKDVGLGYLTLSRNAGTLSGGEAQRIRLATQIGSGLVGVLYILDEPSIGLHQRDNQKLINTLINLRDLGNTLIVVEHDEDTIRTADYIIDIGVLAGDRGGNVVAKGSVQDIIDCEESLTGQYLSGKKHIAMPQHRREITDKFIEIKKAEQNNLKKIDVKIPLGVFTSITGVSGSGKSSLINDILYPYLAVKLNNAKLRQGKFKEITGLEYVDKVISIDQSPIGRTPRSNAAT
ncbi:MAG: excinuclease ABC subunit UvrA, partial [Clostridia bacterium]